MKLDSTVSHSTADGAERFLETDADCLRTGNGISGLGEMTGSEVEPYCAGNRLADDEKTDNQAISDFDQADGSAPQEVTWCYLFVHHQKVAALEQQFREDGLQVFVHRSVRYVARHRNGSGRSMHAEERPSVSGLIFLQGGARELQQYLNERVPGYRLCRNCSTGCAAEIPSWQMIPFMRVAETDPERIRFLLHPFVYYSKNRTLLRIVSGPYAGLEGYVVRIASDRRLVLDVGGMAVALSGVHAERFEEVAPADASAGLQERNLQERQAFIDRYFHAVRTPLEARAQAESMDLLREMLMRDVEEHRLGTKEAFESLEFMMEEVMYYYASQGEVAEPVMGAAQRVLEEMEGMVKQIGDEEVGMMWMGVTEEMRGRMGA